MAGARRPAPANNAANLKGAAAEARKVQSEQLSERAKAENILSPEQMRSGNVPVNAGGLMMTMIGNNLNHGMYLSMLDTGISTIAGHVVVQGRSSHGSIRIDGADHSMLPDRFSYPGNGCECWSITDVV